MGLPEKPGGADRVGSENQQKEIGHLPGNDRHNHLHPRLYPPHRQGGQNAPDDGERQADPAPEVAGNTGIIPEPHAQKGLAGPVVTIFHRRGRKAAPQHQPPSPRRQGQHRRHPQAVHRAQGQQQKAFPALIGGTGGRREGFFQAISQKAIYPEDPKPARHSAALLFPQFLRETAADTRVALAVFS